MILRTFFDRNNTLVYNRDNNTGKNPVTELFYGGGDICGNKLFSRFIFQFSTQRIEDFRANGMYPDLTKLTHTLKMTNTGAFDKELLGGETADGKDRSSSFNLNLFEISGTTGSTVVWDEGVGYDYEAQKFFTSIDGEIISLDPSNWAEYSTGNSWPNGNGTFSGWTGSTAVTVIDTQHFEDGNENIEMDVTDIVNRYLTGATNNGMGLAFDESLELSILSSLQYVGFFTRHTQTSYEPFIESRYSDTIVDSRGNFYMDKLNKLYLYTNLGGVPTDVDSGSTIVATVLDNDGGFFSAFTGTSVVHESQGVYSIELLVPTTDAGCVLYEDIWSGITMNGITVANTELEFELKEASGYYNIGDSSGVPKKYTFNISGIRDNEKINRGDIRKVSVMARVPYSVNQQEVLDSLEYRLYIKEGHAEYTIIDYTPVDLAFNYNYFLLDTASLVPQTYYLDVKLISNYEVTTSKNVISFDIMNQVDKRKG